MKKTILTIIWLSLSLSVNTCYSGQKWFKTLKYEGTIFEFKGGPPKPGVPISLGGCTEGTARDLCDRGEFGNDITDSLGQFAITIKASRAGRYMVTLDKGKPSERIITGGHPWTTESELKSKWSEIFYTP